MSATDPTTHGPSASPLDRHAPPVAARGGASGRAIASLVLGIIALLGFVIPIAGLILGIIAIVMAVTQRKDCARRQRSAPWQATAGLVLGSLAVVLSVALWIAAAISAS